MKLLLQSTYLAPKLIENKIHAIHKFFNYLYTHGSREIRIEVKNYMADFICPILSRVDENLLEPLRKEGVLLATETDKIESLLAELPSYIKLTQLAVKMLHVDTTEG